MAYIDKSTQWTVSKEPSYGVTPVIDTTVDYVEAVSPSMDASTDMIDREVLKNSMVKAQPLLGKETTSGSMEVEFSTAKGAAGSKKINGDLLYESALGKRISDTASEVASNVTTGTVSVADGTVYTVGQAMKLEDSSAATVEYAVIRSISGNDLTVKPTPTADGDDVTVTGLVSFVIASPDAPQISLAIQEYLEGGANPIEYTYNGAVASDVSVSFPVANIVKANFSLGGAGYTVEEDTVNGGVVANRDSKCTEFSPYIAKNMTFTYAGTAYAIENLDVKVASDVYDTESLTTDGITNKTATGKSEVGGSFGVEYTGTSLFSKFQAGTSGEIFGTVANAGSTALVYAPKVVLTEAKKSVDSGIYKESLNYTCLSSGLSCGTEDAITLGFE